MMVVLMLQFVLNMLVAKVEMVVVLMSKVKVPNLEVAQFFI